MPSQPLNPNLVLLSHRDESRIINRYPAGEDAVIVPGMLIEQFNHNTLGLAWRRNSSATNMVDMFIALPMDIATQGINTPYVLGDNLVAYPLHNGVVFYPYVPSGQNVTAGDRLQSNGDGTLKAATSAAASAGVGLFKAQETTGAVNALTRVRTMVVSAA